MSDAATTDRLIAERNEARENERAMSDAYVRLRVILGAMDPPTTRPAAALWAYVENVARTQAAEITSLRRWKSTHAPRLAAFEAAHKTAQADAEAGREAAATLASERAANALLTDEVERLRALSAQPAAVPTDWLLRSKLADLLHLLEFSAISTATGGDDLQARKVMADLRAMLAAPQAPQQDNSRDERQG